MSIDIPTFPDMAANGRDWWEEDKKTVNEAVFRLVEHLDQTQTYHRSITDLYLRFYSNRLSDSFFAYDVGLQDAGELLKLNVIKAVVDSATAHIASNRPRAQFLTFGGKKSLRKKAENLGKFVAGQFYRNKTYAKGLEVFRDAALFGTGYMHVFERDGDIAMERVFPGEIIVDQYEARYAPPRQLFRHKEVTRSRARGLWPKHREAIDDARLIRDEQSVADTIVDPISVVESWHLPSTPGADDGRHVISVSSGVLVDEPYESQSFPIIPFRWTKAPVGWEGVGLAEELASIQTEINYLLQKAQRILNLATYQIWLKKGDGIPPPSNRDGGIGQFKSTPPVSLPINTGLAEIDNKILMLWDKAFQQAGISEMQAQGKVPPGVESGTAMRVYNDTASARFLHTSQEWERFYMEISDMVIQRAREIHERGDGDIKVLVQNNRELELVLFSDVALEADEYTMRVFPTNLLPDTPTGKLETLETLAKVVPDIQPHFSELLDMPDLDAVKSRINSSMDLIDMQIEGILERGEDHEPHPQSNLQYAMTAANRAVLQAVKDSMYETDEENEANIERLRVYATMANDLLMQKQAPQPPPSPGGAQGPPPGAGGGGGPPPVSPEQAQEMLGPPQGPLQ